MQKWYLRTNEAIVPIKLVENCNRSRSWNWRSKSLFCEAIIELKDLATALNLHQFELSITGSSVISCPDSRCHHCTDTHTHAHKKAFHRTGSRSAAAPFASTTSQKRTPGSCWCCCRSQRKLQHLGFWRGRGAGEEVRQGWWKRLYILSRLIRAMNSRIKDSPLLLFDDVAEQFLFRNGIFVLS